MPAPVPPQTSKASVPLLSCRAAARQRRRDFPVSPSVSHTHTYSPRRLSALSREYFSYFPMPYLQKQESRVPYAPCFCPLPFSSCPPRQMMLRLAAIPARGCLFESPEPRERLGTSGTPQRGRAAALTQPRAQAAPSSAPAPVPALFPSGHRQTGPGGRCQAGAAPLFGSGRQGRRHLARAIVCWPGAKAWPGGVVGWFPSSTAAGLQRHQQWDFAVPALGCTGSGGSGGAPATAPGALKGRGFRLFLLNADV